MENLKLLFQIYYRPASAMSDIMDRASCVFAAAIVLAVSVLYFATVNTKLNDAYSIPSFSEFLRSSHSTSDEDTPEAIAEYNDARTSYQEAVNERPKIPIIGDRFFQLFSFEPTRFFEPLLLLSLFYVPG